MINTAKVFLIFLLAAEASAQIKTQDLDVTHNLSFVLLEDSGVEPEGYKTPAGVLIMTQFNTIDSPLTLFDVNRRNRREVVEKITSVSAGARWALGSHWGLGFDFSASSVKLPGRKEDGGFGDTHIQLERQLRDLNDTGLGISLVADVYLPTGDKDLFLSNGAFGGGLSLVVEKKWQSFLGVLNVGARQYGEANYQSVDMKNQWPMGVGVSIPLGSVWTLNAEGRWIYLPDDASSFGTGEVYLGGMADVWHNGQIHFGVSASRIQSDASGSARLLAGFKFHPFMEKEQTDAQIVMERVETVHVIDRCGPQSVTERFSARRLTPEEIALYKTLPYRSTSTHQIGVKQIGEMTALSGNTPYVSDAQILFAIDLFRMPLRKDLISLDSARLKMSVRKISRDHSKDTEILCLLNHKVCSGVLFEHGSWKENINAEFFGGKETPNDYFTKQYLSKPVEMRNGAAVFAGDLVISMSKVIENSLVKDLYAVFYPKGLESARTLYFLVADDTYISNETHLEIGMTVDTCETSRPISKEGRP